MPILAADITGQNLNLTGVMTCTSMDTGAGPGASVPSGGIILWSGSTASIPTGWVLCNGLNSTPDLRDRFVVGAGNGYAVDATGGSDTVTLTTAQLPVHNHPASGSSGSAGSHNHPASGSTGSAGSHSHPFTGTASQNAPKDGSGNAVNQGTQTRTTSPAGSHTHPVSVSVNSAGSHSHPVSVSVGNAGSGNAHENRPPYYALAYIMKT